MTSSPYPDPSSHHASSQPRRRGPQKVDQFLASALRDLGVPSQKLGKTLHLAWAGVCEPAWRNRTWLVGHEGGVLKIGVSSAALREELVQYHAERLLGLMRTSMPSVSLAALRFVVDDRPPSDGQSAPMGGA